MTDELIIRTASEGDVEGIHAIYAREVLEGTASFELTPPDVEEMRRRLESVREAGYPYLAATISGRVAGYAYAVAYRSRPAYRFTVENSVYVADWARRRGVGSGLLEILIARCQASGYRQMVAVIGDSAHAASISLHRKAGFRLVGTFEHVGYKFGRWLDTVLMQRSLGDGAGTTPAAGA